MDWQYTNDRTVELQRGYPHSSRYRFLAVLPAPALTLPSARPQARLPACLLALQLRCLSSSLKRCCPHPRGSRSDLSQDLGGSGGATRTRRGGATRTRLPFPCSSGSALRTYPDGATHASQRCLASKRFSPVSVHSIASIVEPGRPPRPTLAWRCCDRSVTIAILASDGGLKLLVELPHSASLLLPSLLAVLCHDGIPHTSSCGATRQHL